MIWIFLVMAPLLLAVMARSCVWDTDDLLAESAEFTADEHEDGI